MFTAQLRAFKDDTEAKANAVFRTIALDILRRLIVRSPVDTGRFRGNWQTGINAAPSGDLPTEDPSGQSSFQSGQSNIGDLQIGQSIFIVNNLPYAIPLENGHSQQAPNGMVGLTVQEYPDIVQSALRINQ